MSAANRTSLCSFPEGAARVASNTPSTSTGRRVLIIDDEPPIRDVVSRILGRFGHRVQAVANGGDALALAGAHAFDLIICDLNLPGLSGLAVYGALVRENLLGGAVFALATGDAAGADSVELGGNQRLPLLSKPFGLAQLLDLVTGPGAG